jgi:formylmethanofuran dehydrogenase subunit E
VLVLAALLTGIMTPASAQSTPDEWIALGRRVRGGFGTFIPTGIRIGLDAMKRLEAGPRDVAVTYYDTDKAPCACVADGVMIATTTSPGQRTLTIAAEKAPAGIMAVVVVRHRKTGKAFRYTVAERWLLQLAQWNRTLDERGRYDEVMKAEGLFEVAEEK